MAEELAVKYSQYILKHGPSFNNLFYQPYETCELLLNAHSTTGLYAANYTEFETIAKGGFGTVCKALGRLNTENLLSVHLDKLEARLYAIKKVNFPRKCSEEEIEKVSILKGCNLL